MEEVLRVVCPKCEEGFTIPREVVELELSHEKMRKVLVVSKQMHNKFGIFYDRWLAAMEARGEQMRCSDCLSHRGGHHAFPENYCVYKLKVVHPSWFACNNISYYEG